MEEVHRIEKVRVVTNVSLVQVYIGTVEMSPVTTLPSVKPVLWQCERRSVPLLEIPLLLGLKGATTNVHPFTFCVMSLAQKYFMYLKVRVREVGHRQ